MDNTDDFNPQAEFSPPLRPVVGAKPPKLRYTHNALIDLVIAHPEATQNWLAEQFGYTPAWVSTVMTSDAFQSRLAERRKEVIDPALMASIEHRFKAVSLRSLEIIAEKLNAPTDKISDQLALQTLAITSKAAGFGAREQERASPVSVHVHLESMADNLTKLLDRKKSEARLPESSHNLTIDALTGDAE